MVNQTWLANKSSRRIAYRIKPNAQRTGIEYSLHYDDEIDFDPKEATYGNNKLLCPCCGEVTPGKYMRVEGMAGRIEQELVLACEVSSQQQGRFYRLANDTDRNAWRRAVEMAASVIPIEGDVSPDRPSGNARGLSAVTRYGMLKFADFFNARQTVTLDAFARTIRATREEIAKSGESVEALRGLTNHDIAVRFQAVHFGGRTMPQTASETNRRVSLRIPPEDKALLMRAAALEQTNLTEFMVRASLEAARGTIHRAERLALSERDSLAVLDLLENPPAPNARLVAAAGGLPDHQ